MPHAFFESIFAFLLLLYELFLFVICNFRQFSAQQKDVHKRFQEVFFKNILRFFSSKMWHFYLLLSSNLMCKIMPHFRSHFSKSFVIFDGMYTVNCLPFVRATFFKAGRNEITIFYLIIFGDIYIYK